MIGWTRSGAILRLSAGSATAFDSTKAEQRGACTVAEYAPCHLRWLVHGGVRTRTNNAVHGLCGRVTLPVARATSPVCRLCSLAETVVREWGAREASRLLD